MKINTNKCSSFIDGATIEYNGLKSILTQNIVLKRQVQEIRTTFKQDEGGIA